MLLPYHYMDHKTLFYMGKYGLIEGKEDQK